ncbi:MAG: class I SAM-dependent methyltransferase [Amoebophilaceae bacterium]|nr:class I SAM-dependent methyltransferase [Amoebophilaceae bacterium]
MFLFIINFLLHSLNGFRILDVGCGDCYFLKKIKQKYPLSILHGIDIIYNSKCKCDGIDHIIYDGTHWPKNLGKFSTIFCMNVMYHITDKANLINHFLHALDENGTIIITTKSNKNLQNLERIHTKACELLRLDPNIKGNLVSEFCSENSQIILSKILRGTGKRIKQKFNLCSTIIASNKEELKKYFSSCYRYSINRSDYKRITEKLIDDYDIFVDYHIEQVIVIG